jgi:hypothetical protein
MRYFLSITLSLFLMTAYAADEGAQDAQDALAKPSAAEKAASERLAGKAVKYPTLTDNSYSVVDDAQILSPPQALQLNKMLFSLYQEKEVNLKLSTIKDLKSVHADNNSFEKYAAASYSQWNIMAAGSDLRILVSYNQKDNHVVINGPADWQKENEANIDTLVSKYFMPKMDEHKVAEGIIDGMDATAYYLRTGSLPSWFGFFAKLILFIAVVGGAVYYGKNNPENALVIKAKEYLHLLFEKLKELLAKLVEMAKEKLAKK